MKTLKIVIIIVRILYESSIGPVFTACSNIRDIKATINSSRSV